MSWEMQSGDPLDFAFKVAFTRNPHGDEDASQSEDRESWGSFSIYADGENLTAHRENDELVQGSHWYLLPLIEWIIESWDPLLHEERLPLKNVGESAAAAMETTKLPPLSLKEVDEFDWMDSWVRWWTRHNVRAAREGGLFPDVYIRRYRDELEISTGGETLPGVPLDAAFLWANRTYRVEVATVAQCFYEVLTGAIAELRRRLPHSERLMALEVRMTSLTQGETRRTDRLAWLSGLGDQIEQFGAVSDQVDDALRAVGDDVRQALLGHEPESPLVVSGTPYARLLYGALSPDIELSDVSSLATALVSNYVPDSKEWLARIDAVSLDERKLGQLSPGEQGSRLGEDACELIGMPVEGAPLAIDVERVLADLGVAVSGMSLSDASLRAVSVIGPFQKPHVFMNPNFARGRHEANPAVHRFTLAHELCHLLLDKEHGDELAIASGPWAPVAIEQRANAFAAAFLMPSWLLREALVDTDGALDDIETISGLADRLHVSLTSLVDRLLNLGELTYDDRIRLRTVAQQRSRRGARAPRLDLK